MTEPVIENDPFGTVKQEKANPTPPPRDVNMFHTRADTDTTQSASHHTIGIGHTQASAGDHLHNGINSRKVLLGAGYTINNSVGFTDAQRIQSIIAFLHKFADFTEV